MTVSHRNGLSLFLFQQGFTRFDIILVLRAEGPFLAGKPRPVSSAQLAQLLQRRLFIQWKARASGSCRRPAVLAQQARLGAVRRGGLIGASPLWSPLPSVARPSTRRPRSVVRARVGGSQAGKRARLVSESHATRNRRQPRPGLTQRLLPAGDTSHAFDSDFRAWNSSSALRVPARPGSAVDCVVRHRGLRGGRLVVSFRFEDLGKN